MDHFQRAVDQSEKLFVSQENSVCNSFSCIYIYIYDCVSKLTKNCNLILFCNVCILYSFFDLPSAENSLQELARTQLGIEFEKLDFELIPNLYQTTAVCLLVISALEYYATLSVLRIF